MANPWDEAYSQYANRARSGDITADFIRETYGPLGGKSEKGNSFADRVIAIHQELEDQRKKYKVPTSGGQIGEADTVWDTAFRLAETGTDSLYDLGQRQKEVVGYGGGEGNPETYTSYENELYHKPTGAAVTMPHHGFKNEYALQFTPDGTPVPYSTKQRSDWVDFREDFLKPAASLVGSFIPGVGPYIAAANAAYAASKGDWEKALLSGLSAAVPLAGKLGASIETANTLNNVRQAATVLKALESKDLLGAALGGANLAGVSEVAGFSTQDIGKALGMVTALQSEDPAAIIKAGAGYLPKGGFDGPKASDFESGSFDYGQIFDPKTSGLVDLSDKPLDPNYKFTTDFSIGADYGLAPKSDGLGFQVTAPPEAFNPDGSINYDLLDYDQLAQLGMDMPKSPNIEGMGGGQGLRIPVQGGYITEAGFIPEGYTPDLGDPNSFINKPPPGGNVSIKGALNAGAKATLGDLNKQKAATQKPGTAGSGIDINQLMSLLGGGQQTAPTIVSSGQDNSADVQLMEDIFGTTMSAPPAGDTATQARELARLLRS